MKLARAMVLVAAAVLAVVATITIAGQLDRLAGMTESPTTTAPQPLDPGDPVRVTIPAIGVDAPLVPVGLRTDGAMETPDFGHAAWYRPGPRPGEPGPAVLVAHVDAHEHGPDVFFRLRDLRPGDRVTVHYADTMRTFTVTDTEQAAKTTLPTSRIWPTRAAASPGRCWWPVSWVSRTPWPRSKRGCARWRGAPTAPRKCWYVW